MYKVKALKRLMKYSETNKQHNLFIWNVYKIYYSLFDWFFYAHLRTYDVIIISDCIPIGFYKESYNIEKLRKKIKGIPILIYEVYFLGNAPTILEDLVMNNQATLERYDWHLSISDVTEIRQKPAPPWSQVGLYLKSTGLKPNTKNNLLAVIDFARKGHEDIRNNQISILEELEIPYVSLERRYTIEEIRSIYQQATFYFMQSREAFGVPIAECLSCGSYIITPDSSWPMSWRLDENPEIHGSGTLPECFIVYNGAED